MMLLLKCVDALLQPLGWCMALLLMALWAGVRRPRMARRATAAALLLLALTGWMPLPDALLRHLENQHAAPADLLTGDYAGVIVLGGALEPDSVQQGRAQVALNDAAERLTVPVALLRARPGLQLLFTGGSGQLWPGGETEAALARRFFIDLGVPAERLRIEEASRTTDENARFSARLPGIDPRQRWLLLTSASHQARALLAFRAAGWNVTPCPVDYRTGAQPDWTSYQLWRGAQHWQIALHEVVGLWGYQLREAWRSPR